MHASVCLALDYTEVAGSDRHVARPRHYAFLHLLHAAFMSSRCNLLLLLLTIVRRFVYIL